MTNKEFFIKILEDEQSKFRAAIEALPDDKFSHKVHDRSREAGSLAGQLAVQWKAISGLIKNNKPDFDPHDMQNADKAEMLAKFDASFSQLLKDLETVTDQDWENTECAMGEMWKDKKYNMCWGFLFDAIHHRGQLSTYLRAMGAKVPAIYGPSADTK